MRAAMLEHSVFGTILLAVEGFNASLCGESENVERFIASAELILETKIVHKSSFHSERPFRKHEVRIKKEIVTLKKAVDISMGAGTQVKPVDWNAVISDPEIVLLDARNHYEHKNGSFQGAINPNTDKFSELPQFVAENLDPTRHKKVAMYCTGGIRCEKFAPYMKGLGFAEV